MNTKLQSKKKLLKPLSLSLRSIATADTLDQEISNTHYLAKIAPSLYLSDYQTATDEDMLKFKKIRAIINLASGSCLHESVSGIEVTNFALKDKASADITADLRTIADLIAEYRSKNIKVLVHCNKGISRAPTAAIAYLILKRGLTFEEAFASVKEKVPKADPNFGYLLQLKNL